MTTTSITAVSVSTRSAQSIFSEPTVSQLPSTGTVASAWPSPYWKKTIQASAAATKSRLVVTISEGRSPISRPKRPAIRKPRSGRKTIRVSIATQPFRTLISSTAMEPRLR